MKRTKLNSYIYHFQVKKMKIWGIFFNFYIKLRDFLHRAASCDVKYLSNDLNELTNGFYEEKKTEINIFTIFRRQKLRFCGFSLFSIKITSFYDVITS